MQNSVIISRKSGRTLMCVPYADMAELADALDLGSNISRCAGSSPVIRTN